MNRKEALEKIASNKIYSKQVRKLAEKAEEKDSDCKCGKDCDCKKCKEGKKEASIKSKLVRVATAYQNASSVHGKLMRIAKALKS